MHTDIENAMQDVEDAKINLAEAMADSRERINRVYKTLKRVPDDIILAVMTDDLNLADGATCLVGSVVREKLFQMANLEFVPGGNPTGDFIDETEKAVELFGGTEEDWGEIYAGVVNDGEEDEASSQEIEIAFVRRVDLAVTRA